MHPEIVYSRANRQCIRFQALRYSDGKIDMVHLCLTLKLLALQCIALTGRTVNRALNYVQVATEIPNLDFRIQLIFDFERVTIPGWSRRISGR